MAGQRSSFGKLQRDRAKKAKASAKRERRVDKSDTTGGRRLVRKLRAQMARTFWASSPLRPGATSNSTFWPSSRER